MRSFLIRFQSAWQPNLDFPSRSCPKLCFLLFASNSQKSKADKRLETWILQTITVFTIHSPSNFSVCFLNRYFQNKNPFVRLHFTPSDVFPSSLVQFGKVAESRYFDRPNENSKLDQTRREDV